VEKLMRLKKKLLLASSAIVLVILSLSEWIGYRQTSVFLTAHAKKMETEYGHAGHGASLKELQEGSEILFVRLATLHSFHAALTLVALVLALNALWNRAVLRPLSELLEHMNYMRRGTWKTPVPVRNRDEIGELTEAFNELGEQLTLTVQQFGSASKLSAMALLGQSMVRKVFSASEILRAAVAEGQINSASAGVTEWARLQLVLKLLDEIPDQFEKEFKREMDHHSQRASNREA
jgi:HAMP domain-containing protein